MSLNTSYTLRVISHFTDYGADATSTVNTTTSTATYSNVGAINVGGVVISDGVNVRLLATTNATVTLATVNGGEAAGGTYND